MNDPNQEILNTFYLGYDWLDSEDPDAEMLFHGLIDFLVVLSNNKSKIFFHVLRSGFGKVWSYPAKDNNAFSILWDTAQWELFDCFLDALITKSIYYTSVPPFFSSEQCDLLINKLLYHTANYYNDMNKNNSVFADYLRTYRDRFSPFACITIPIPEIVLQIKQELLLYAKMFVMMHEFEHILTRLCPEIHDNDLHELLDKLLINQINLTKGYQTIRGMNEQEYHAKLKDIINPPNEHWKKQKEEIYGDLHAFTEMIASEEYNLAIKDHKANIPSMILAVKLFNMFRTYICVPEFLIDQLCQESKGGITHEQLNANMAEYAITEIELRQVTHYDLTMAFYEYYNENDSVSEGRRIITGMIISTFISTYRNSIQPLILSLQYDINEFYYSKEGSTI